MNQSQKEIVQNISEDIECVVGDIRDKQSLNEFFDSTKGATLFHLAGIIHPKKIKDLFDINSLGVKNILDMACQSKIKRAIIISSNSPIGCNKQHDELFDENSSYNPYLSYGKSKLMAEDITNEFYKSGKKKREIKYNESAFDLNESFITREWNINGKLIYDRKVFVRE